jgi:beta-1,4-mannosyl-glycoprotein beta-1,4-N-acetylglucosaminyltransferase
LLKRKVFDCFPFWKEFDVLEVRLNELNDVVDKFIIVESAYTHSGENKPFYLKENLQRFAKFKDKIILTSIDRFRQNDSPNQREIFQRNVIGKVLKENNASKEDLIIISDCDEIPRALTIRDLTINPRNCILELDGYISYFNLYFQKWHRGRVLLYKDFKSAQKAHRDYFIQSAQGMRKLKLLPFLRINPHFASGWSDRNFGVYVGFYGREVLPIITNAGWHFTKMFPAEDILESVFASSHIEFRSDVSGIEDIIRKRTEKKTYYGGESVGEVVVLDKTFPKYLVDNKERFKEFIIPI